MAVLKSFWWKEIPWPTAALTVIELLPEWAGEVPAMLRGASSNPENR